MIPLLTHAIRIRMSPVTFAVVSWSDEVTCLNPTHQKRWFKEHWNPPVPSPSGPAQIPVPLISSCLKASAE